MVHLPRRMAGLLLVVLGAWAGILPYVGPLFGYRIDTAGSFVWTTPHWELNLAPGIAAIVAGLVILGGSWAAARLAAWLGMAAGAWLVLGPLFASLWLGGAAQTRVASSTLSAAWVPLGYHYGTGLVIVALAAFAYGRAVSPRLLETGAGDVRRRRGATTGESSGAYPADPAGGRRGVSDPAATQNLGTTRGTGGSEVVE
jgi:hypothetical protein